MYDNVRVRLNDVPGMYLSSLYINIYIYIYIYILRMICWVCLVLYLLVFLSALHTVYTKHNILFSKYLVHIYYIKKL